MIRGVGTMNENMCHIHVITHTRWRTHKMINWRKVTINIIMKAKFNTIMSRVKPAQVVHRAETLHTRPSSITTIFMWSFSVILSFVLYHSVNRITDERGNGRRPNLVGTGNRWPSRSGWLLVVIRICAWIPVFHFLRHWGIGDFPTFF